MKCIYLIIAFLYSVACMSQDQQVNYVWLCDSTNGRTFYRIKIDRPGKVPYTYGSFLPNGNSYTPSTPIVFGPCSTTIPQFADSSYQYELNEMCDDSLLPPTDFIRIYKFSTKQNTGVNQKRFQGDFKLVNGNSYTPSTQINSGHCGAVKIDAGALTKVKEVAGVIDSVIQSQCDMGIFIANIGNDTAILYINSDTINLQIKSAWNCDAIFNPLTKTWHECPAVKYDARVTRLQITKRRKR